MIYAKANVENGNVALSDVKEIDQSKLTSDCFLIQINGAKACETCECLNKPKMCGGMKIREQLGVPAPVTRKKRRELEALSKSVKFSWLSGDINWLSYGGSWISNKLNNGSFDYYLILEITNLVDSCGEREAKEMGGTYSVGLNAVAPSQVSEDEMKNALSSWGMEDKPLAEISDSMKAELLNSYGIRSTLWHEEGNNAHKLLRAGRGHAREEGTRSLDQALASIHNRLGHTGMDFLKGDISFETAKANREKLGL